MQALDVTNTLAFRPQLTQLWLLSGQETPVNTITLTPFQQQVINMSKDSITQIQWHTPGYQSFQMTSTDCSQFYLPQTGESYGSSYGYLRFAPHRYNGTYNCNAVFGGYNTLTGQYQTMTYPIVLH